MADEDIYGSKRRYERKMQNLEELTQPPPNPARRGQRRYYCRNPVNLKYFEALHRIFASRDTSYVRRNRVLDVLLFVVSSTDKDLATCERNDIDETIGLAHQVNRAPSSKEDFLKSVKFLWKNLFPEVDERGRPDERIVPYVVRHISCAVDKSRSRMRNDRLTRDEFERLVSYFSGDPQIQAYISVAIESLGRPQEMCYRRVRDLELHENYGRIWVSSHGKEGTKFLQCIDSFPYLVRWLEHHPFKGDPDAFLFMAGGLRDRPLTPAALNKKLRAACSRLGIEKRITAYSLKRNGVTFRRLRGDSDVEIQHVAGWTSTKQLQIYDLSSAEDTFKGQLVRRGLVAGGMTNGPVGGSETKLCVCGERVGFAERLCPRCKRVVGSEQVRRDQEADQEIREVFTIALSAPDRSFAEIIKEYRQRRLMGKGMGTKPTSCSATPASSPSAGAPRNQGPQLG